MSQALKFANAYIVEDFQASHAALLDLAAEITAAVLRAEDIGPPLTATEAHAEIDDRYEEFCLLRFSREGTVVDRRDKAMESIIAHMRYIRDVCGDK